jgi:uncharacterized protein (TIGR02391 family)
MLAGRYQLGYQCGMTRGSRTPPPQKQPANPALSDVPIAIQKLERRLREFREATPDTYQGRLWDFAQSLCSKLDGTLVEIFGPDTLEFERVRVGAHEFTPGFVPVGGPHPRHVLVEAFKRGQAAAVSRIGSMIEFLSERLEDTRETGAQRTLRAYQDLDLHPVIADAASTLYEDGHYANAIEDAVKALNNLVRLKSGEEFDGTTLMERVFSPSNPILKFNELSDKSDTDEQKGFMMLFSGAVSGLRNPRAHKLIQDDPERALEFIAFVSLLAKLSDGARKVPKSR